MKMKLFASDLDGTLLNEKHIISQQSADVIRIAQRTGKKEQKYKSFLFFLVKCQC